MMQNQNSGKRQNADVISANPSTVMWSGNVFGLN